MLDLVVRVPRLPVLGESLFARDFQMFVGGKGGNQALAAARLGASHVSMIGRVGDDPFGERITTTLMEAGIDCTFVSRDQRVGTGVAIPMVFDDGRNSIISVPQANLALTPGHIEAAREAVASADMLMVQFEVTMDAVVAAMRVARDARVPILLNPAPVAEAPAGLLAMPRYLVLNEVEAAALAPDSGNDPANQAAALLRNGPEIVVITLGEHGCVTADPAGVHRFDAFPVEAMDSVGAGDAFCGGFAVAVCEGRPLPEAVRFASAAGAISVTRPGAAASLPTRDEVELVLRDQPR